jgi:hypothetical protein
MKKINLSGTGMNIKISWFHLLLITCTMLLGYQAFILWIKFLVYMAGV